MSSTTTGPRLLAKVYFSFDKAFAGPSTTGFDTTWYDSKEAAFAAAVQCARHQQDIGVAIDTLSSRWRQELQKSNKATKTVLVDSAIEGMRLVQTGQGYPIHLVENEHQGEGQSLGCPDSPSEPPLRLQRPCWP